MLDECKNSDKKSEKINHEKEKELLRLPSLSFGNVY